MAALRVLSSRHQKQSRQLLCISNSGAMCNLTTAAHSRRQVLQKAHHRQADLCRRLCSCLFMGRVVTVWFFRSTWSPFGA